MRRRAYLATATAAAVGLAGCSTFAGGETDDGPGPAPDVESLDDFEDLDRWETIMGSVAPDTERSYTGSQSVVLTANGAEQVRMVREFEEPRDMTGMNPGLAAASDGLAAPSIQLVDGDENWLQFRQTLLGGVPLERYGFGLAGVNGDPDLSAVEQIHISRWVGEEEAGQVWVDDLHLVPRPDTGLVTLQIAGGHESTHDVALPAVQDRDLSATAFVPPSRLREDPDVESQYMTVEQVEALGSAGWTVGSQSARDQVFTGLEPDEQEADVVSAIEWLEDNGFGEGARFFSYPANAYDESALEVVGEHHDLGFASQYPVHGYVVSPERAPRVMNPSASEAERAIDATAQYGGITALAYYGLEEEAERSAMVEALDAVASRADAGEIEVVGPATIADEYTL